MRILMKENNLSDRSEIARRALREAEERNRIKKKLDIPEEYGGRDGLEPTRYNDWEVKGIVSDF